jgi:hypothetical protein
MKHLITILAIAMLTGCSSKTITYDSMGEKTIKTIRSEDQYHQAQRDAWTEYYLSYPVKLADIAHPDGTVTTIYNQVPPPAPAIRQHQNQYIKPVADIAKWVVGGVVLDRGIRAVVNGAGDTIVDNAGDGTVYVDRSDMIAGEKSASFDTQTETDNSQTNPAPVVVDPVVVEQPEYNEPVIVQPEIVRPEIVIPSTE